MSAFSLRLPEPLEREARAHAKRVGISLNSVLCVALDAYLGGRELRPNGRQDVGEVLDQLELSKDSPRIGKGPTIGAQTGTSGWVKPSPPVKVKKNGPEAVSDVVVKALGKRGRALLRKQTDGFTLTAEEKAVLREWREAGSPP